MTNLCLQRSSPVPFGAVGFPFNGAEVPPHQLGLLPLGPALRAGPLGWPGVRGVGDPQSLELNLNVFGRAALLESLTAVVLVVAQNVTLFDETVRQISQARLGLLQGILPAPAQGASAALRAAAQAAFVGVQRAAALAGLTGPLAAGGILEDF